MVKRRSQRVELGSGSAGDLQLAMTIGTDGRRFRGVLSVTRPGEPTERRAVTGMSCDEVVDALALTAALSIDPEATVVLSEEGERNHSPLVTAPASATVDASHEEEASLGTLSSRDALRFSFSPFFAAEQLMNTGVHAGGGLRLALSGSSVRAFFPLEIAASVFGLADTSSSPEPNIRTTFLLGNLVYCPIRLGTNVSLLLCPSIQLGVVSAESHGFDAPSTSSRFFATLGLEASLRAPITEHLEFWLAPGLEFPLTARSFAVAPGPEVLSSTVLVGPRGWAGIGWKL